jgi:EAL domain-containing protein (putative c-di-GMP-specific phosphodiesterase class I)
LAYLQGFPADEVKIDRSFVMDMHSKEDDTSIVRAAIALAHDLGMTTVAEGVETKETCEQLAQLRCDAGQGYYFGRPMQSSAFAEWLAEESSHRPVLFPANYEHDRDRGASRRRLRDIDQRD